MTIQTQRISTETLLQIVADSQRRVILQQLMNSDTDTIDLDKLTQITHTNEKSLNEIELYHTHLPKLAEAGIINYDTRNGTIKYHSTTRLEHLLQFVFTQLE